MENNKLTNGAPQIPLGVTGPVGSPGVAGSPAPEYLLSPDELSMVAEMQNNVVTAQTALTAVLQAIIRYRKLADGAWHLESGKLTKQG